jgi:hypothetical protein
VTLIASFGIFPVSVSLFITAMEMETSFLDTWTINYEWLKIVKEKILKFNRSLHDSILPDRWEINIFESRITQSTKSGNTKHIITSCLFRFCAFTVVMPYRLHVTTLCFLFLEKGPVIDKF